RRTPFAPAEGAPYTRPPLMPRTYREAYERLLPLVEKPGRYLGNERGAVCKDRPRLRFALAFPEVYEIAQSHLGLQILYDVLNRRPDVAAERAYAPWPDMEALLRARDLPLVSLESHTALGDFHVVGFSLQYELTYTNLLTMLELGRIPLRACDRGAEHPIVIAGGPCAFNPEPLAPFLVGLDRFAPPENPVVPNLGVVHDRASVEVMRGCVKGCRFCQAGYVYRPLRERNPERVVEDTTRLMARTGYEEVSLLSLSTGD